MFLYCFFIIGFSSNQLQYTEAYFLNSYEAVNKDINNKKDLINIIKSLNRINDNLKVNNKEYKKIITNDITEEMSDSEKEKKLQEMLWLIKEKYKQYNLIQNPTHSGARIYFIRNPDVIDEYKKYLEQKKTLSSTKRNFKNKLQEIRRKVMFRVTEDLNDRSESNNDFDKTELNADDRTIKNEQDHQNEQSVNINKDNVQYINDVNDKETDEEPLTEGKLPVDSLEIHNEEVHQNVRANSDYRREKSDSDVSNDRKFETEQNWGSKKILNKHHNIDSIRPDEKQISYKHKNNDKFAKTNKKFDEIDNNKFENSFDKRKRSKKTNDIDKLTTKEYYKRKIIDDEPKFKPRRKPSYRYPKNEFKHRNDLSSYVRTSIPYVGKKGIYEDD